MQITPNGTNPSTRAPAEWFTGVVRFDTRFRAQAPAGFGGLFVTFEPGARTNWHTHPRGQLLIVTAGLGWAQSDGGPVQPIRPGDVVWFDADERHWHGACDHTAMTHIAIAESQDGSNVTWAEPVVDADYRLP